MKFLLIEDNKELARALSARMQLDGHVIDHAKNFAEAVAFSQSGDYDLILLDIMLPDGDGRDFLAHHRAGQQDTPVIVLTARSQVSDRISMLDLGADDYVTKPFSPKILNARVHAMLRRSQAKQVAPADRITIHALKMNLTRFQATLDGHPLPLTKDEFQLLFFLARHPGWVFTRYQIVDGVKGEGYVVTERAVDVRIAGLRKKLGPHSDYIETVRGVGYRFRES